MGNQSEHLNWLPPGEFIRRMSDAFRKALETFEPKLELLHTESDANRFFESLSVDVRLVRERVEESLPDGTITVSSDGPRLTYTFSSSASPARTINGKIDEFRQFVNEVRNRPEPPV